MATDESATFEAALDADAHAIDDALAQAREQLSAMNDAASSADQLTNEAEEYSIHEVAGVGRYAVVRRTGWRPLLKVINDHVANIDFSPAGYPAFDAIIGANNNFPSPYLLDPLDEKFGSYRHLRENLAAVRNFLMETYYVNTPPGMTPDKAQKTLEEIADYVGKGLRNNYEFLGFVPNHDPFAPFISLSAAKASGGDGAQYIYEKILEMQRQSNWMRPFSAVVSLFGGKPAPDWMLPSADHTDFKNLFETDIAKHEVIQGKPTPGMLEAGVAAVSNLEAQRAQLMNKQQLNVMATDMDAIANHLLATAGNMQNVSQLSDPVRRDAIDIAKDILRKLKVSLGNVNIMDGLKLPPKEDVSALGAIKGVAMVYERLVAWGRGVDPSIMQHPSVLAATQALGQMGYLAKLEALRMARAAGNNGLAESLADQLKRIPDAYAKVTDSNKSFGAMLDKVERGIDTIMNRLQALSGPGAKIGISAANELGSSINAAPVAGAAMQATNAAANARANTALANQQALLMTAENNVARKQAATTTARADENAKPQTRPVIGRPVTQQTKPKTTSTSTTTLNPLKTPANLSAAQLQALRNSALHHAHEHEEAEHQHQMKQMMDNQRLQAAKTAQKAAAKAAMSKIDPNLLKGFQTATSTHGLTGAPVNPGSKGPYSVGQYVNGSTHVASVQNKTVPAQPKAPHEEQNPFVPTPPSRGGGRGF